LCVDWSDISHGKPPIEILEIVARRAHLRTANVSGSMILLSDSMLVSPLAGALPPAG
jgi:hypothetical protein